MESSVAQLFDEFGLKVSSDSSNPGVWIGKEKIAAIGVQFKDRYTLHGIAINIVNDLSLFRSFVPCGIQDRGVTSLQQQTSQAVSLTDVKLRFAKVLAATLGSPFTGFLSLADLQKTLSKIRL